MSKKQDILDASLRLFTDNGARATSTKSIAMAAHTSEALIFKHFGTKDNLLEEIIKKGYQEATKFTATFLFANDPKDYLISMIDLPHELVDSNFDFWRMQYKILPLNPIAQQYHNNFMKPSSDRLTEAFRALNYNHPDDESEILLLFIDSVWKSYVAERLTSNRCKELAYLLKKKYFLI